MFTKIIGWTIAPLIVIVSLIGLFSMASAQQALQFTVDNVVVVPMQPEVGAANIGDNPGDIRPAVMNDGVIKVSWRDAVDSEGKVVSGWFSTQFGKVEFSKAIGESEDGDIIRFDSKAAGWQMVAGETLVTFYIMVDGVELAPAFDVLYVGRAPVLLSCEIVGVDLCAMIVKYWIDPIFKVEKSQIDGSFATIYEAEHTADKGEVGPFEFGTDQQTITYRVWAIDSKTQRVRGYLEVTVTNPCFVPPATTPAPTITPTEPMTPTVTPTVPFTPTIVITPTIPAETPTPIFPFCTQVTIVNWTWMGSYAHATMAAEIMNPTADMNLQVFGLSSISSPMAAAANNRQVFMVEFQAVAGAEYFLAIDGVIQPNCKWEMSQVFLGLAANGPTPEITPSPTPTTSVTPTPVETPKAERLVVAAKDDPWCAMKVMANDWNVTWIDWSDWKLTKCPWAVGVHNLVLDGHNVVVTVEKSQNAMLSFVTAVTIDGTQILAHKDHRVRAVFGNLVIEVEEAEFEGNHFMNIQISWIGWPNDWFIPME